MHVLRILTLWTFFIPILAISSEQHIQCDVQKLTNELNEIESLITLAELEKFFLNHQEGACIKFLKPEALPVDEKIRQEICGGEPCGILKLSNDD